MRTADDQDGVVLLAWIVPRRPCPKNDDCGMATSDATARRTIMIRIRERDDGCCATGHNPAGAPSGSGNAPIRNQLSRFSA